MTLIGAACGSAGEAKSPPTPAINTAIFRTARYFDTRPPRGDVGFLLGQGSMRLSSDFKHWSQVMKPDPQVTEDMKDPSSLQYLEAILWLKRGQPHPEWKALPPPSVAPDSKPTTLSDDELANITTVISFGLKCKQLTAADRTSWLALLGTPSHSYLLTHQVLSLVWGRETGCLTDAEANPLRTTLATALYAELRADGVTVNDLTLESMAMLCYADLCNWVSDRQTKAVVTRQHSDGSWGDGSVPINPGAFVPPEHTAGLGFYVLAMKWDPNTRAPSPPG